MFCWETRKEISGFAKRAQCYDNNKQIKEVKE